VTPGMVLDENLLEPAQNNFLAALRPPDAEGGAWGGALLDASTGEFVALQPGALSDLQPDLLRVNVGEVLVPAGARLDGLEQVLQGFGKRPAVATCEPDAFVLPRARAFLL